MPALGAKEMAAVLSHNVQGWFILQQNQTSITTIPSDYHSTRHLRAT
jgi:hypothetical protein